MPNRVVLDSTETFIITLHCCLDMTEMMLKEMLNGKHFNSFPAGSDFCRLLITLANSLDPDQARQNVGPDLDPNCLTL